jgi:hypothetical protein
VAHVSEAQISLHLLIALNPICNPFRAAGHVGILRRKLDWSLPSYISFMHRLMLHSHLKPRSFLQSVMSIPAPQSRHSGCLARRRRRGEFLLDPPHVGRRPIPQAGGVTAIDAMQAGLMITWAQHIGSRNTLSRRGRVGSNDPTMSLDFHDSGSERVLKYSQCKRLHTLKHPPATPPSARWGVPRVNVRADHPSNRSAAPERQEPNSKAGSEG